MASNRVEVLKSMLEEKPGDGFARYGLAMEYVRAGELETAVEEFVRLLSYNPGYAAAYFHGGQTLEKLGRIEEARAFYNKGIQVTTASGDDHTRSELKGALDMLG